ncbi:MAG TPA: glycosyltransferase family 2 protein [Actinomycetota bacterium]|nr:glycosyltransferase family 2 protein [Actinomycetota bacterium]
MRCIAVIPAYNNAGSIADTIRALVSDARVSEVLVIDDGSSDLTSARATEAGARVVRLARNSGKGRAMEKAVSETEGSDVVLMVDADTGDSANAVLSLLRPIELGQADMVVGVLPPAGSSGGFGLVRDLASLLIRITSGYSARAPMSGQRAIRREVLRACLPLAEGFAIDAALTSDAAQKGFTIVEQDVDMTHDHRGRSLRGFLHRANQGVDLLRAFTPRLASPRRRRRGPRPHRPR